MKKLLQFIVMFLAFAEVTAQTPMYFNSNTQGGQNAIPFNAGGNAQPNWRRTQFFVPANSIGSVGAGNNITKIWFLAGSATSLTYANFTLQLKSTTATGLSGTANGPFESGMTTVLISSNQLVTTTLNAWFGFTLQTPFLYDPTKGLIVDIMHDQTTATGPTIHQPGVVPGGGTGRQWGNINGATISGTGTQLIDFGIDVIPATPCTVTPGPNTLIPVSYSACAGGQNPALGVVSSYSFGGITYQWQMSTQSALGPFTAMPGYTNSSVQMPTLSATSWFNLVATCTNVSNGSTTISPVEVYVYPTYTSSAPYYESFEGIGYENRLPNCSWFSQQLGSTAVTYTSSNTNGRVPRTGGSFASFYYAPPGVKTVYTHGIQLEPGITYSASLWYQTEYYGYNNWTDLSILLGPNQSTVGQVTVATTNGPAVSNIYKSLSNTFTVGASGIYYVAIRATSSTGSAQYLSWDDLAIEMPCSMNTPSLSVSASQGTICEGDQVILNAGGVDSYYWSTGDQGNIVTVTPPFPGPQTYYVTGTSTLTGCSITLPQFVMVNPKPQIFAIAVPPTACEGQQVYLYASGGDNYIWSNNSTGAVIPLTATLPSGTIGVSGSNQYNCSGTAVVNLVVNPKPNVGVQFNSAICVGEPLVITSTGAQNYTVSSPFGMLYSNPATYMPTSSAVFTITGADQNGCTQSTVAAVSVDACTAVQEMQALKGLRVYPNPTGGMLTVELNTSFAKDVEITDVTGRIVMTQQSTGVAVNLNMSILSAGVYYVKVKSQNSVEVVRVVKQ